MENKVVVTDGNGNEILNAEDRKIAQQMLDQAFKTGQVEERADIVSLIYNISMVIDERAESEEVDEQEKHDLMLTSSCLTAMVIPKIQERGIMEEKK